LRFEHVEHLRPECLRRSHNERSLRIPFSGDAECSGRTMNRHSILDQRIDEFRRR